MLLVIADLREKDTFTRIITNVRLRPEIIIFETFWAGIGISILLSAVHNNAAGGPGTVGANLAE